MVAIHRRVAKDESFVILRGKVRVTTHNDDGAVIGDVVLSWESGLCLSHAPKPQCALAHPRGVWRGFDGV